MLNEILLVERGARQAGIEMAERHPDIKECRRMPTLLVRLNPEGHIASVQPVPADVTLWTLRDGQHNSFPFVQPKPPLLAFDDWRKVSADRESTYFGWPPFTRASHDEWRRIATDRRNANRRSALLSLADEAPFNGAAFAEWPGTGLMDRIRERRALLSALEGGPAAGIPATMDRFLLACNPAVGGGPCRLLGEIIGRLTTELRQTADSHWLDVTAALLLGKYNSKTGRWECDGALLFDAEGDWPSLIDGKVLAPLSDALRASEVVTSESGCGCCALTGETGPLVQGKFPQPNLRTLGQTFLFARNEQTPAAERYGRTSADTMPVGQDTAIRLASAIKALTADDREGITWRAVPGEAPKQMDLLLAFVEAVPDAPAAGALADGETEEDLAEEAPEAATDSVGTIAAFEKRAQRVIDAVRANVQADFTQTPVRLAVIRKVDPANRKVIYAGEFPVKDYHRAATAWVKGERNVPPWLRLPVLLKSERKVRLIPPPHVAPLGVIAFSRQLFARGGIERLEIVGLPAVEALALFLGDDQRLVRRMLRLVLVRRAALVSGTAHALRRGLDAARAFDRREALRTITLLGVLLQKLARRSEDYMNGAAFKLGQLLAAADVVHAGYCADVRGGDLPPSLLGNQVFTMAQAAPVKALAMLCRRWKPYDGWAKKTSCESDRIQKLQGKSEQRYWDIRKALRHAREMRPLADELSPALAGIDVNDTFRAELLLGYIAGLPKAQREAEAGEDQKPQDT